MNHITDYSSPLASRAASAPGLNRQSQNPGADATRLAGAITRFGSPVSRTIWVLLLLLSSQIATAGEMLVDLGPEIKRGNVSEPGPVENHAAGIAADIYETRLGINSAGTEGQTDFDDQQVTITFTPSRAGMKMVAFSDDGVTVTIRDLTSGSAGSNTVVLSNKGVGQALPNLNQSLKDIDYTFETGHTYEITVDYLNTYYTGDGDVDGAQLIAYGGENEGEDEMPQRPNIVLGTPVLKRLGSSFDPDRPDSPNNLAVVFDFAVTGAGAVKRVITVATKATDDPAIKNNVSESMYFASPRAKGSFILFRGTDHNHGFSGFLHHVKGYMYPEARQMQVTSKDYPEFVTEHKEWRTSHVTMQNGAGTMTVQYEYAAGDFSKHAWVERRTSYQGWPALSTPDKMAIHGTLTKSEPTPPPPQSDYPYGQAVNADFSNWINDHPHSKTMPIDWADAPKSSVTFTLAFTLPADMPGTATLIVAVDDVDGKSSETIEQNITRKGDQ